MPESTRFQERPDPGIGWRHRLERRLLLWPVRLRSHLLRWEADRLRSTAKKQPGLPAGWRDLLRLEGFNASCLLNWYKASIEAGVDHATWLGALAVVRGMSIQCGPEAQLGVLTCALPALALTGRRVHLLCADDREAEVMFSALEPRLANWGIGSAVVTPGCTLERRRHAYRTAVTIVSAREALADYLDDRLRSSQVRGEIGRKLRRLVRTGDELETRTSGLPFGIVLNTQQTLIEQACEPITISGRTDAAREKVWAETALSLARSLEPEQHYRVAGDKFTLTENGDFKLSQMAMVLDGAWRNAQRRNDDVTLALRALQMVSGMDYRCMQGGVEVSTPLRATPGLLQLLQVREGVPVTGRSMARGKLTYQRFFQRYLGLAGLSDDTRFLRSELWQVYGLADFELMPAASRDIEELPALSAAEEQFVAAVSHVSTSLAGQTARWLRQWHARQRRRAATRLRAGLLHQDARVGTLTAFTGRPD